MEIKNPYDRNDSVGQVLLLELRKHSKVVNQVSDDTGIKTTCEIYRKSWSAQKFEKMGLTNDDVIGFMACNNHNLTPVIIGALSACIPVNPLDCSFTKDEIVACLTWLSQK